jgi:UDP-N-acetylglucosamine transferase subunit ALG13
LAASGGGHIRQLIDLEPAWINYDYFFVSEDTALSRSLANNHPVDFLCHFAFGQIRREGLTKTIVQGIRNFCQSIRVAYRRRPDVIISTGAGSVFFLIVFAKLLGAKFVLVETFARFDAPSKFARMVAPFADHIVVQSARLKKRFPNAASFDPLEILSIPRPEKKPLVFATVGVTLPFDRMTEMVVQLKSKGLISEEVVMQTGIGAIRVPQEIQAFETLPFETMQEYLRAADIVICHGGTGSIITALREGCRTIVIPRNFENGEHYDNHQWEIMNAFAARGLIFPANSLEQLAVALQKARAAQPILATTNPTNLIGHLSTILGTYAEQSTDTSGALEQNEVG